MSRHCCPLQVPLLTVPMTVVVVPVITVHASVQDFILELTARLKVSIAYVCIGTRHSACQCMHVYVRALPNAYTSIPTENLFVICCEAQCWYDLPQAPTVTGTLANHFTVQAH